MPMCAYCLPPTRSQLANKFTDLMAFVQPHCAWRVSSGFLARVSLCKHKNRPYSAAAMSICLSLKLSAEQAELEDSDWSPQSSLVTKFPASNLSWKSTRGK